MEIEKIIKVDVKRYTNYLYFINNSGDLVMRSFGAKGKLNAEHLVLKLGLVIYPEYSYSFEKDWIVRRKIDKVYIKEKEDKNGLFK